VRFHCVSNLSKYFLFSLIFSDFKVFFYLRGVFSHLVAKRWWKSTLEWGKSS
jgi:hypothetical protein